MHSQGFMIFFFFFSDTATTEIYTLSLHDALPICGRPPVLSRLWMRSGLPAAVTRRPALGGAYRSEEHTSELQSQFHLVCRLLLEKKKKTNSQTITSLLAIFINSSLSRNTPFTQLH